MKYILSFALLGMLLGCSDGVDHYSDSSLQVPNLSGKPKTIQVVKSNWGKLMAHCPGLSQYHSDLTFAGLNDMVDPVMEKMSRVEVLFKITDNPEKIPNNFRAWGHTCGYGISPDGTSIRIQKRTCVSVCLGGEYKGSTDYVSNL